VRRNDVRRGTIGDDATDRGARARRPVGVQWEDDSERGDRRDRAPELLRCPHVYPLVALPFDLKT
jgi:hypothetical protein